jgi:hypothetical protein
VPLSVIGLLPPSLSTPPSLIDSRSVAVPLAVKATVSEPPLKLAESMSATVAADAMRTTLFSV